MVGKPRDWILLFWVGYGSFKYSFFVVTVRRCDQLQYQFFRTIRYVSWILHCCILFVSR
jgi:hypothetical protein